jgi:hypothetical protein
MTATKPRQPTLPPFESNNVANAKVRITRAGDGLSEALKVEPRAIQLGESVYYVLSGECVQVNHVEKDEVLTRVHTIAAERITEIDGETAMKMLTTAAEELERKKATMDGQMALDDEQAARDREQLDATDSPTDIAAAAAERAKGK